MKPLAEVPLTFVDSWEDVQDLLAWLSNERSWLGVDIETTGLNLGRDRVRIAQVGDVDRGWVIPVEGYGYGALVKHVIESYRGMIAMHNSIFDASFLKRDGIRIDWRRVDDSMPMAHIRESSYRIGLKPQARRFVSRDAVAGQSVLDEAMKASGWTWATVPVDFGPYWKYSALDPVLTCRIAEHHWPDILGPNMKLYETEMAAIGVLVDAQLAGMRVDVDHARAESARLEAEMATIRPQCPVSPASPKQLVEHFLNAGARLTKKTERGNWSVDDEVLKDLDRQGFAEAEPIRQWRKRDKLKSSYFDNLLELQTDGVVHPSIRVLGAEKTGRMSISAPALQTLPKSKVGRSAFVARDEQTLIMADFDGMEMRMLAHLAQDEQMLENFHKGIDQHGWLAEQVWGELTKQRRIVAKTAGFAKIYGAGISKFAMSAGITEAEAADFIARYDALFPGVHKFQEECIARVRATADGKYGRINTWTGRSLMVPVDEPYKAVNYADQGGCSELTKLKIAELANAGLRDFIRIPIHDEVVFEAPDEDREEVEQVVSATMEERELFSLPFPVDVQHAKCWGDVYD